MYDSGLASFKVRMLAAFFGPRGSPEMMSEVLREAVRRQVASDNQEDSSFKIKVTIKGWGKGESYEISENHLSELDPELHLLEDEQNGTKLILKEVLTTKHADGDLSFGRVLQRVNIQQKKLTKFNVHHYNLKLKFKLSKLPFHETSSGMLLFLLKLCKEWRIAALSVEDDKKSWRALAAASNTGQIGTLILKTTPLSRKKEERENQLWRSRRGRPGGR